MARPGRVALDIEPDGAGAGLVDGAGGEWPGRGGWRCRPLGRPSDSRWAELHYSLSAVTRREKPGEAALAHLVTLPQHSGVQLLVQK